MVDYERKIVIGILIVAFASLPALGFALTSLSTINQTDRRFNSIYVNSLLLTRSLRTQKMQQNSLMPAFVLSGDRTLLDQLHQATREFNSTLQDLDAMEQTPEVRQALTEIGRLQQHLESLEQPGIDMKEHGVAAAETDEYFRKNAGPPTKAIVDGLYELERKISAAYDEERAHKEKLIGSVIQILAIASLVSVAFCIAIVRLLTRLVWQKKERDRIRERLAQQEREISHARKEAVEIVAHDLRAPLSAILMAAELVERRSELPADSKSRNMIETIQRSADRMSALIGNLLDHAKIEAGLLSLSREEVDITLLLNELVAQFEISAAAKPVLILNEINSGLPTLLVDKARIEQVFANLIANAVKFTLSGGSVRLCAALEHRVLRIDVVDTGPGMTTEQAAHVFDKFWQARETSAQGAGLGLTIVKAIVEAHGGRVGIKCKVGTGCTFSIYLPLEVTPSTQPYFGSWDLNASPG